MFLEKNEQTIEGTYGHVRKSTDSCSQQAVKLIDQLSPSQEQLSINTSRPLSDTTRKLPLTPIAPGDFNR
jgi:hypothetical protein